jgi:hypothetical protein
MPHSQKFDSGFYFIFVVFIRECIESCFKDIYNYMKQEDSKIYFGHFDVRIGKDIINEYFL